MTGSSPIGDVPSEVDSTTQEYIRQHFYKGIENEEVTEDLIAYFEKTFSDDIDTYPPFALAYLGATETLLGKHAFDPFSKLGHLEDGLEKLAKAIEMKPLNLEFRFIRFSILHHLPFFLGYGEEREDDRFMIVTLLEMKMYEEKDKEMVKNIIAFMIESDRLSENQLSTLLEIRDSL